MEFGNPSVTHNLSKFEFYFDGDQDDEVVREIPNHSTILPTANYEMNRLHHVHGEEIVPLDLDYMVEEIYIVNDVALHPNRLTSLLGQPEKGKRELRNVNYPPTFTFEGITLDLCRNRFNESSIHDLLNKLKPAAKASVTLKVDEHCMENTKSVMRWFSDIGKSIVSFHFLLDCKIKLWRQILPLFISFLPNLETLEIVPHESFVSMDAQRIPNVEDSDRMSLAPNLEEIIINDSYLLNTTFLYLMLTLRRTSLIKCGTQHYTRHIGSREIPHETQKLYYDNFQLLFETIDEEFALGIRNLHHKSNKTCMRFFMSRGHFP